MNDCHQRRPRWLLRRQPVAVGDSSVVVVVGAAFDVIVGAFAAAAVGQLAPPA